MSNDTPFRGRQNLMAPGWAAKRRAWLRQHPLCNGWVIEGIEHCREKAVIVDHIIPRFEGGGETDENLQSLCKAHSDRKTAEEGHRAWAAKKAATAKRFDFSDSHPGYL